MPGPHSRSTAIRILVLHSRYLSGPISGENRVVDDEARLLADAGHDVDLWAPSASDAGAGDRARAALAAVWSRTAAAEVRRRIRALRAEIVHVHNLFPMLSPAVLRAAEAEGVPALVTLHNFRLVCLPATLHRAGHVCEACVGKLPWRGVVYRCYRGSAAGSAALAGSLTIHRAARTLDRVRLFLAVSGFVRDKHVLAGFPAARIIVKPNFVPASPPRQGPGDYFLFLGRLSPEKGLAELATAWRDAPGRLVVAGDGTEAGKLLAHADPKVELLGAVTPEEVPGLLAGARALVFPSLVYEGAPRAVLEAYAAGVPVIASKIGSLVELVAEGESGLLVPPGDPRAWTDAVRRLHSDELSGRLGDGAAALWRRLYSPEQGLVNLETVYAEALSRT